MNSKEATKYAIGIDFGTESGRALLVDVADGREIATAIHAYRHGVIDERLPNSDVRLQPDWALQEPADYIDVLKQTIPALLQQSGIAPQDVISVGIDFTSCTILPTTIDGTPLCHLPDYRQEPHAWVKLWKHHAAQIEADRLNDVAREQNQLWLASYGGKISSESFFSKVLQILNEAPAIYHAADRILEAGDWLVWQLTGNETRNACAAGYKANWLKPNAQGEGGYPSRDYLAALHPDLVDVVQTKINAPTLPLGSKAGGLTAQAAEWTGLCPGTTVAVSIIDAHANVPAAQATEPGVMTLIMGTSNCHMVLGTELVQIEGICGVVEDGMIPGFYAYEAGQSGVGDIFAWFVEQGVPHAYYEQAQARNIDLYTLFEEEATKIKPGAHGLIALDWWNGNRSTLVDSELSGMLIGMTLATTAPEIYRALLESTAFGTRKIIETLTNAGIEVNRIVAAGGLPERNPLLMQIYADVTNREFGVVRSALAGALGAAMYGTVAAGSAAGGYDDIFAASSHMGGVREQRYTPIPTHVAIYDQLYAEYSTLYEYFGRGENDVMKRLRELRHAVLSS